MGRLTYRAERLTARPARLRERPKAVLPFYHSPEWRAAVRAYHARMRAEHGSVFCEKCGAGGVLILDHVVEIKDGGAMLDEANLELLCRAKCHPRKTAMARRRRVGLG